MGDRFTRIQTTLSHASDDMDDASRDNIEQLHREAAKMIRTHHLQIDRVCEWIAS